MRGIILVAGKRSDFCSKNQQLGTRWSPPFKFCPSGFVCSRTLSRKISKTITEASRRCKWEKELDTFSLAIRWSIRVKNSEKLNRQRLCVCRHFLSPSTWLQRRRGGNWLTSVSVLMSNGKPPKAKSLESFRRFLHQVGRNTIQQQHYSSKAVDPTKFLLDFSLNTLITAFDPRQGIFSRPISINDSNE